jgi:hypothetical protein
VGVGELRGADDLVPRGARPAVRDVLPDRRPEQHRFLKHQADLIAKRRQRVAANVAAVDAHQAASRIVEPRNEADERRFPAAGRAHEGDPLPGLDDEVDVLEDELIGRIAELYVRELDTALERRCGAGTGQIPHLALGVEKLTDSLEADHRLRDGVRHLRQIFHRLVHLSEVEHEDEERAGRQAPGQDQAHARQQDQTRSHGDEDVDDWRQSGLDAPSAQRQVDAFLAFAIEAAFLVLLAAKRLHDADRRDRLLHDRRELALLSFDLPHRVLDPSRQAVHDHEHDWRDRERHHGEPPIEVDHHAEHAGERQDVHQHAKEDRRDEVLRGIDVARQPDDHIAGLPPVEERQRQALDMVIEEVSQVVDDVLADRGRQVLLSVRAERSDKGNRNHRERRGVQQRQPIASDGGHPGEPLRRGLGPDDVVEHDLERPRFEQPGSALDEHCRKRDGQEPPVRADQPAEPDASRRHFGHTNFFVLRLPGFSPTFFDRRKHGRHRPELPDGLRLDLADALAAQGKPPTDLFERVLLVGADSVSKADDLAFAVRQLR